MRLDCCSSKQFIRCFQFSINFDSRQSLSGARVGVTQGPAARWSKSVAHEEIFSSSLLLFKRSDLYRDTTKTSPLSLLPSPFSSFFPSPLLPPSPRTPRTLRFRPFHPTSRVNPHLNALQHHVHFTAWSALKPLRSRLLCWCRRVRPRRPRASPSQPTSILTTLKATVSLLHHQVS